MSADEGNMAVDEEVGNDNDEAFIHESEDSFHFNNKEDDGDHDDLFPGEFDSNSDGSHGDLEESLQRAQLEAIRQEQEDAETTERKQDQDLASLASSSAHHLPQSIPGLGQADVGSHSSSVDKIEKLEAENSRLRSHNSELQSRVSTSEKYRKWTSHGPAEKQLSRLQFEVGNPKTGLLTKVENLRRENQKLQAQERREETNVLNRALERTTAERDLLRDQLDEAMLESTADSQNHSNEPASSIEGGEPIIPANVQHHNPRKCSNCEEMQKQLDALAQEYTSNVMQKDAELHTKTEEIQEKNTELETKERTAQDAKIELKYFGSEISRLDAERKSQLETIKKDAKTITRLRDERDDLRRKLASYSENLGESQGHVWPQHLVEKSDDSQVSREQESKVEIVTELQNRLARNRKEIFSLQEQVRGLGGTVDNTLLGTPARVPTPNNDDVETGGDLSKTPGDIAASLKLAACEESVRWLESQLQACNEKLEKKDRILDELHTVVEYLMAQVQAGGSNPYLPSRADEGLRLAVRDSSGAAPLSDVLRPWLLERDELLNEAHNVIKLLTVQVEASGYQNADIPAEFTPLNPDRCQNDTALSEGVRDWLLARDVAIRQMIDDVKQARTVEITGLQAKLENIQPTIIQLESEIERLQAAVGEMDAELQVLRPQVAVAKTDTQKNATADGVNFIPDLQTYIAAIEGELKALKEEQASEINSARDLRTARATNAGLQHQLTGYAALKERVAAQDITESKLHYDFISERQTNRLLQAKIADLKSHARNQEDTIKKLEAQSSEHQSTYRNLQSLFDKAEARIQGFSTIDQAHKRERADADQLVNALRDTINELHSKIAYLKDVERNLQRKVEELEIENAKLEQQARAVLVTGAAAKPVAKRTRIKRVGVASGASAGGSGGGIGRNEIVGLESEVLVGGRATRRTRNKEVNYREGDGGGRVRKQGERKKTEALKRLVTKGNRKTSLALDPNFVDNGGAEEEADEEGE